MTLFQRIQRIAQALGFNPAKKLDVVQADAHDGHGKRWWLYTSEGNCPLPRTQKCHTINQAIDAAEAWLAPELSQMEEENYPYSESSIIIGYCDQCGTPAYKGWKGNFCPSVPYGSCDGIINND